jgi:hypothetical protein
MVGGDSPQRPPAGEGSLECLLWCLAGEPGWQNWLKEHGLDPGRFGKCLDRCGKLDTKELDLMG